MNDIGYDDKATNIQDDALAVLERENSKKDASAGEDPGGGSGHGMAWHPNERRKQKIRYPLPALRWVFHIHLPASISVGALRRSQQEAHASTLLFRS
jgi:hypothetical protein